MNITVSYKQTGHLVHVSVTVFDDNGEPVVNLGLVNPWMCEAILLHGLGEKSERYLIEFTGKHSNNMYDIRMTLEY